MRCKYAEKLLKRCDNPINHARHMRCYVSTGGINPSHCRIPLFDPPCQFFLRNFRIMQFHGKIQFDGPVIFLLTDPCYTCITCHTMSCVPLNGRVHFLHFSTFRYVFGLARSMARNFFCNCKEISIELTALQRVLSHLHFEPLNKGLREQAKRVFMNNWLAKV